jgi:hypothetical protein
MPAREDPQRNLFDHSYYILIASFVILFFNAGARFSIGVVFKPMIAEFAWSRSAISLAVFINMAVFALSLTVVPLPNRLSILTYARPRILILEK